MMHACMKKKRGHTKRDWSWMLTSRKPPEEAGWSSKPAHVSVKATK